MDKVIFQKEWLDTISKLPEEQQLSAYKALLNYALYGIEPEPSDIIGTLIVGFAKPTIQKDNAEMAEYAEIKNRDRVNGAKGGRPKKEKNPLLFSKELLSENKNPLSEEKNPLFNSENPLFEEKKPLFENKNPLFENKNPLFEEKTPFSTEQSEDSGKEKQKEKEPPVSPTPPIPQEKGKVKEKEKYDVVVKKETEISSSPSSSSEFFPVGELEDRMLADDIWVDSMLYKFRLDKEQLAVQLHTFCRGWIERGDNVKTLKDAKRHADSLLNIRQRDGDLADPPRWNQFLADLMLPYADELAYDFPVFTAFGKHYMQDPGNGKPFFLGIPHFEEDIRQRMKQFKTTYIPDDEQPDQPRSGSQPS